MSTLVTDAFFAQARARPSAPAVGAHDGRRTYAQLAAEVTATAWELVERLDGDAAGSRVALSMPPGVRFLEVFLAAAAAGAQAVVCDPAWSDETHAAALAETRPALVFADESPPVFAGESPREEASDGEAPLEASDGEVPVEARPRPGVEAGGVSGLGRLGADGGRTPGSFGVEAGGVSGLGRLGADGGRTPGSFGVEAGGVSGLGRLGADGGRTPPRVEDASPRGSSGEAVPSPPAPAIDDTAGFYVGFTSGTTGRPRGFVRSHRSWVKSVEACEEVFGSVAGEHVLAPGSLAHSLFLFAAVHSLCTGACVHLLASFGAHAALRVLRDEPVTRLWAVPAMVRGMVRAAEGGGSLRPVPGVRSVLSSGAAWPPELARQARSLFPEAVLTDFYGASELSFVSACDDPDRVPATCVGRPLPQVEVSIRRDDGSEAATGEAGLLWVRSPLVFSGYLTAPSQEAEGGPASAEWVTVGDIGRWDEDGRLHRLGRADDAVNTGGVIVAPQEVEEQLRRLPEIAEVAVVGIDDPDRGQALAAVIRWRDGVSLSGAAVRRHCRATLPPAQRPRRYFSVGALPTTTTGKVARGRLREELRSGTADVEELA